VPGTLDKPPVPGRPAGVMRKIGTVGSPWASTGSIIGSRWLVGPRRGPIRRIRGRHLPGDRRRRHPGPGTGARRGTQILESLNLRQRGLDIVSCPRAAVPKSTFTASPKRSPPASRAWTFRCGSPSWAASSTPRGGPGGRPGCRLQREGPDLREGRRRQDGAGVADRQTLTKMAARIAEELRPPSGPAVVSVSCVRLMRVTDGSMQQTSGAAVGQAQRVARRGGTVGRSADQGVFIRLDTSMKSY
jgi:hypothetical protein